MKLLDIDFGKVWNAAGARNFSGEGYWQHWPWWPLGLRWAGATFVSKTCTRYPQRGNMPLRFTQPRELKPACIKINYRKKSVLNAVGLSNPGIAALLHTGRWQRWTEPFLISVTSVASPLHERMLEISEIARVLARARAEFSAPFGLEVNVSCPNTHLDFRDTLQETRIYLDILRSSLEGVPLIPKLNVLIDVETAADLAAHPACNAITVSNTLPYGSLPDRVNWPGLFGKVSPLASLGGGGLSGEPLHAPVLGWLLEARRRGFPRPLVAGGGIMEAGDAAAFFGAGAAAVQLGSVAIVRPWRVQRMIDNVLFNESLRTGETLGFSGGMGS